MRQINKLPEHRLPELLAPAGSFEHLKAAVKAGADAVYMGGQQFSARAYADNFSRDTLVEALHYAHFYETRLYLTVNTLMKEKEIEEKLYDFLYPFYEEGLDGVIVQDIGAAAFLRTHFPQIEIHGSTQMTITDVYGAKAAARMGMNRIVPARELSLSELRTIKEATGLELEVFIHGALCYCYSGQCLLSSMYGGRSGNWGRCAQPCRLPYRTVRDSGTNQTGHLLSPKDLCAIGMLPELIRVGVDSLKIEGRMKNVEYVAGVTAIYRKYLDEYAQDLKENVPQYRSFRKDRMRFTGKHVSKEDYHHLEELYSRDGFTEGYWHQHNGKDMMSTIYPRNVGRKIGQIASCSGHQMYVRLQKGEILHPKDILIVFLSDGHGDQKELVLTVPENIRRKKDQIVLNVPKTKGLREGIPIYRRRNESLSRWIHKDILEKEIKFPISGKITLRVGQPAELTLQCRDARTSVIGDIVQASMKRPVAQEDILRQMNKTGGTPFFWVILK